MLLFQLVIFIVELCFFINCDNIPSAEFQTLVLEMDSLKANMIGHKELIKQLQIERENDRSRIDHLEQGLANTLIELNVLKKTYDVIKREAKMSVMYTGNLVKLLKRHTFKAMEIVQNLQTKIDILHNQEQDIQVNGEEDSDKDYKSKTQRNSIRRSDTEIIGSDPSNRFREEPSSLQIQKKVADDEHFAFSASMSTAPKELGLGQVIPFDRAQTNIGNAFDPVLHVFICPINGVYYFHSALAALYNDHIETDLVKDGVELANMYAAGSTAGHGYDQGANSAVTVCNKGERIWIQVRRHLGTTLFPLRFTTFSGFLLFPL